jgi:hypothetical protein
MNSKVMPRDSKVFLLMASFNDFSALSPDGAMSDSWYSREIRLKIKSLKVGSKLRSSDSVSPVQSEAERID